MPLDYRDAADRHFHDAELLYSQGRLANADHLYGLAAECSLKTVMIGLGASVSTDGSVKRPHMVHINELWNEFITFASRRNGARYAQIMPSGLPFANWHISERYHAQSHFGNPHVSAHRVAAEGVMKVLQKAVLDGVL